mgnify:FL=1
MLEKDVEKYTGFANTSNSDSRDRLLWFDKDVTHPSELLKKLNEELDAWKSLIESWSETAEKVDVKLPLAENRDFAAKVFKEFKLDYEIEPLNPDNPLAEAAEN